MSISTRVSSYLDKKAIQYDVISHEHSNSSLSSALTAHVPVKNVAKAVILEDNIGRRLMALLPANYKINLHTLRNQLDVMDLHIVNEEQVYKMFHGCEPGAVPAVGQAFNLNTVYDDSLDQMIDLYLEAGDHETLIHLSHKQFKKLMVNTKHSQFSTQIFH